MENVSYEIQFTNENDYSSYDYKDRIEPNNNWHSLQIPLKSLDDALQLINDLDNYAIKFTRFWKIVKYSNGDLWKTEDVVKSEFLLQYEIEYDSKKKLLLESELKKVEKINKMDKEFVVEENFHGYKIFFERREAIHKTSVRSNIQCDLKERIIDISTKNNISFYLWNYVSDNERLLKKKFAEYINSFIGGVTKEETDVLLKKILQTKKDINVKMCI